ncbi:MAG: dihydropteroate synthase [Crocinitomicaceae bacterium]|nr:dihydropteroate synthase [Crocinitomicaceae bacterium]
MFLSENKNYSINVKGRLIGFSEPLIMGILNVTPDSFYSRSRLQSLKLVLQRVEKYMSEGMDILDIGGVSTRPGADFVSEKEELKRVLPVIQAINKLFPELIISIDTFRSNVARVAIENGAHMVNDVYGGRNDALMFQTIGELNCPYILMHSRGDAKSMQSQVDYNNITQDVVSELLVGINKLRSHGVKDIILDPGFGFAKTIEQNYELFKNLSFLHTLNLPLLVGVSRKSMIYKLLETDPLGALNGTTVLHTFALLNGANILRVHDVKAAMEAKLLVKKLF